MRKIDELWEIDILAPDPDEEEIKRCTEALKRNIFHELPNIIKDDGKYTISIQTYLSTGHESSELSVHAEVWEVD